MASPGFKFSDAEQFASDQGLAAEFQAIRSMAIHPSFQGKRHVPRKGAVVELFESKGLMESFALLYWTSRHTDGGEKRRQAYVDGKALNDTLIGRDVDEDDPGVQQGPDELAAPDADILAFAFEGQLRDFIIRNLAQIPIDGNKLRLFVDDQRRDGREYQTGVGRIDILAADEAGTFFVFELKLDRGPDKALGQLARYMGWVKSHLAGEHEVRGVIVARSIDERLKYAVRVFPNVSLLEYEVDFRLHKTELAGPPQAAE